MKKLTDKLDKAAVACREAADALEEVPQYALRANRQLACGGRPSRSLDADVEGRGATNMTWFGAIYVTYLSVTALAVITAIDEPRKPITPGIAMTVVVVNALLIWGAVAVGTTH